MYKSNFHWCSVWVFLVLVGVWGFFWGGVLGFLRTIDGKKGRTILQHAVAVWSIKSLFLPSNSKSGPQLGIIIYSFLNFTE